MSRSFRIGTSLVYSIRDHHHFIILMLNHRPLASLVWGGCDGDGSEVVEVVSSSAMSVFLSSSFALVVVSFILLSRFSLSLGLIAQYLVNRWRMEGIFHHRLV